MSYGVAPDLTIPKLIDIVRPVLRLEGTSYPVSLRLGMLPLQVWSAPNDKKGHLKGSFDILEAHIKTNDSIQSGAA